MSYTESIAALIIASLAVELFLSFAGKNIQIAAAYYLIPHTYILASAGFAVLSFVLLCRQELPDAKCSRIDCQLGAVIVLLSVSYLLLKKGLASFSLPLFFARYLLLFLLALAIFLFAFGFRFTISAAKTLRTRLLLLPAILSITLAFLLAMDYFWQVFAKLSLLTLSPFAAVSFPHVKLLSFGVIIGKQCSGILSISMFIVLASLIYCLEIKRINKLYFLVAALLSVPVLILINSLRILLLLLVGNISRNFALGLFHSCIGSMLFAAYFILYLALVYKTGLFFSPSTQS